LNCDYLPTFYRLYLVCTVGHAVDLFEMGIIDKDLSVT
jgi:hypothetical protein